LLPASLLRLLLARWLILDRLILGRLMLGGRIRAAAESVSITRTIAVGIVGATITSAERKCSHRKDQHYFRSHAREGNACADCSAYHIPTSNLSALPSVSSTHAPESRSRITANASFHSQTRRGSSPR
jgi:hypothetical protein